MSYKHIALIILLFFTFALIGDELEEKMKQLQNVQKQLESAQSKVKQTETKKKQTESDIQRTASLKRRTDDNLKKLVVEEGVKLDSLRSVGDRITSVGDRIHNLNQLQKVQLDMLLRVDRSYRASQMKHRDQRFLSLLTINARSKINSLQGYKISLMQDKELHQKEFTMVRGAVRKESDTSKTYARTVQNLQKQQQQLTKEQKNLQNQIAKLKKDAQALESLISNLTATSGKEAQSYQFSTKKITWPVRGKIIRAFGEESRAYGTSVVNNGIDIAVAEGTNVLAADDGEVVFADRYGGQGNLVIIDHKNGFFTVYAYNRSISVSKGAKVKKGQVIAKSGMTGSATEPSLHFEVRKDGKAVNPLSYLD
ncbi:MAG: peptidoglycan DD-metalloendopeptidase family protein, partial [Candidatus Cloacimonadaceae bacterium]|nr:peptidoglycan DD-metalloendopeptidase family protein [Candidatus Cloacimonadaceae bacterium]